MKYDGTETKSTLTILCVYNVALNMINDEEDHGPKSIKNLDKAMIGQNRKMQLKRN